MKALVLAGGEGVRLRPLTYSVPKPLIPIGEKPILEEIVRRLRAFGFEDIILGVGYRAELIETYFRDGADFDVSITYVREPERRGTAGALSLVRKELAPRDPLFVMNGDILTQLDLSKLWRWHAGGGYDMSVAVRVNELQVPYGVIETDGERVTGVTEKPVQQHNISAGMYVVEPAALEFVPDDTFFDMPDLISALVGAGRRVGAFRFDDAWMAVDRIDQLEEANRLVAEWAE
jgi:NDP-sugar pyrophosphorylase family protein